MAYRRKKELEIFNFSFLDILSSTIGALIFILILFILSRIHESADQQEAKKTVAEAKPIVKKEAPKVTPEQFASAKDELDKLREKLKQAKSSRSESASDHKLQYVPVATVGPGGTNLKPTHVECLKDHIIIHPGKYRVDVGDLGSASNKLKETITRLENNKDTETMVIWIWPDGQKTFDDVVKVIGGKPDFNLGWEPLLDEWKNVFKFED